MRKVFPYAAYNAQSPESYLFLSDAMWKSYLKHGRPPRNPLENLIFPASAESIDLTNLNPK